MTKLHLVCFVFVWRLTRCRSHGRHMSKLAHVRKFHRDGRAAPCVVRGPRGGPLSCQSRMDEEAGLHSKGLWGNPTNMTHTDPPPSMRTHTHTGRHCQWTRCVLNCRYINLHIILNAEAKKKKRL